MATYRFLLTHEVVIEEENIMRAWKLLKKVRLIPNGVVGRAQPGRHDRDMVPYTVKATKRTCALLLEGE